MSFSLPSSAQLRVNIAAWAARSSLSDYANRQLARIDVLPDIAFSLTHEGEYVAAVVTVESER